MCRPLAPGRYNVTFSLGGFANETRTVDVPEEGTGVIADCVPSAFGARHHEVGAGKEVWAIEWLALGTGEPAGRRTCLWHRPCIVVATHRAEYIAMPSGLCVCQWQCFSSWP